MNNKAKIIGIVVVILVVVLGWSLIKGSSQQVSQLDPVDTTEGFYSQWLEAVQSETTDPYEAGLAETPYLSKSLRERLANAKGSSEIDPVLCQSVTPEKIAIRNVDSSTDKAQVLITSRDKNVTEQALVTLISHNDGWYISDITCSAGEFAPDREFSFESQGYLLKGSIPEPFNPKNWHLVFEDGGQTGQVVPLFFDTESQCAGLDGDKSVCKPDQLTETAKVSIQGQMTERGVSVKKLEFVK